MTKTTIAAIGALVAGVGSIIQAVAAGEYGSLGTTITAMIAAAGLIFAGDAKKS